MKIQQQEEVESTGEKTGGWKENSCRGGVPGDMLGVTNKGRKDRGKLGGANDLWRRLEGGWAGGVHEEKIGNLGKQGKP